MSRFLVAVLALTGVSLFAGIALGDHTEPAKGSIAQFSLVNSFVQCNTPNTFVQSSGKSACTPASPADFCALSSTGSGKLKLSVAGSVAKGNQVIKVAASAKGLTGCEGEQLCLVLSWRGTNDGCAEGSCTASDLLDQPSGSCCTVVSGACKISTKVTAANLHLADGKNTGLELLGCGLKSTFDPIGKHALSCGLPLN
jgi:hypothetical protein